MDQNGWLIISKRMISGYPHDLGNHQCREKTLFFLKVRSAKSRQKERNHVQFPAWRSEDPVTRPAQVLFQPSWVIGDYYP